MQTLNHRSFSLRPLLCLLAVGAILLGACVTPPEEPAIPVTPLVEEEEQGETVVEPPTFAPGEITSQPFFIPGQVILVGDRDNIDGLLQDDLPEIGERLDPVSDFDLGYLDDYPSTAPDQGEIPFESVRIGNQLSPLLGVSSLALRLYDIDNGQASITETVKIINDLNDAGNAANIYADPNYNVSPYPISPCGDPFIIGGSPFIIGGSPFIIGGSPFIIGGSPLGLAAGGGGEADPSIFWRQWAFRVVQEEFTQTGARIAIFDTSPFPISQTDPIVESDLEFVLDEGAWSLSWPTSDANRLDTLQGDRWGIRGQDIEIHLNVLHPPFFVALAPRTSNIANAGPFTPANVRDHGLFAAGLAHGVSGEGEIDLIRVLNDVGCGDLYSLNTAIHAYMKQMLDEFGTLEDVVLNLSLGVPQPPPDFFQTLLEENVDEEFVTALEQEIASLEQTLTAAFARGAIIVAAAGNDSGVNHIEPANIPADYPYVVGVAAENINDDRACYSNLGDISAPGADGRTPATSPADRCEPLFIQCDPSNEACGLGVVSLTTLSHTGYRFWVGTSFAAPLMSGWAADNLAGGKTQEATISDMKAGFPP
jgi:hypothetical protein